MLVLSSAHFPTVSVCLSVTSRDRSLDGVRAIHIYQNGRRPVNMLSFIAAGPGTLENVELLIYKWTFSVNEFNPHRVNTTKKKKN